MRSIIPKLALIILVAGSVAVLPRESGALRAEKVSAYSPVDASSLRDSRTYFTATGASLDDMLEFRRELIERGARHVNFFAPDVIACELPRDLEVFSLSSYPAVLRTEETAVVPYRAPGLSSRESQIKLFYERTGLAFKPEKPDRGRARAAEENDSELLDVVLTPSAQRCKEIERQLVADGMMAEDERGIRMNAEFLGGDILVQTVYTESNGEFQAQSEDWSSSDLTDAVSGVVAGMMTIQQQFPYMPIHFVFVNFQQAETGYEPIKHNWDTDHLWIVDTMNRLDEGLVGDDPLSVVHQFNTKGRHRYQTDWVYTAFVANSQNAPGHRFNTDIYTAYANLGGPYLVIPFPAGGDPNGIGEWLVFSQIYEHESGHIFWALDEYINEDVNCLRRSGYLDYQNSNKLILNPITQEVRVCLPPERDCLMKSAREIQGRPWCKYTQGQMGLIDDNGDSVPDIFDSKPVIEFAASEVETVLSPQINIGFTARSTAVPNRNHFNSTGYTPIDYAAPLKEGQFTFFDTGIEMFDPVDGRWDEAEEEAAIRISSLPTGLSSVKVRVKNAVGRWSNYFEKRVYYIGINYAQSHISVRPGVILVDWHVVGESFGAQFDVYRLGPGEKMPGQLVAEDVSPSDQGLSGYVPYRYGDRDIKPGITYRYYVEANFTLSLEGEDVDFTFRSDVFRETATFNVPAGSIISVGSPNPFREEIKVSVRVPRANSGTETSGGVNTSSASSTGETGTMVKVAVFDVRGRQVKTLHSGGSFSNYVTVSWDGTNSYKQRVPSGMYFVRAQAGNLIGVQKVLLIR